jgi:hypothetical protein
MISFQHEAARRKHFVELSSSITGRPVISPKRTASVDLPEPPGPKITTRFIFLYAGYIGEDYNSRISQIDF